MALPSLPPCLLSSKPGEAEDTGVLARCDMSSLGVQENLNPREQIDPCQEALPRAEASVSPAALEVHEFG